MDDQPDDHEPDPPASSWLGLALVVLSLLAAAKAGPDLLVVITFAIGMWLMVKGDQP
jgi:hypothetical protein